MKDFGAWFNEQKPALTPIERLEELGFEAGEYEDGGIKVMVNCCRCGYKFELTQYVNVEEIIEGEDPDDQYCGSSSGCTP